LIELLALKDGELLMAVAGRRRAELTARHAAFRADWLEWSSGVEAVCRHSRGYPRTLSGPAPPPMLNVAGGTARLAELASAPVVAILGSRTASDYGMEMARSLARGLAASGVTVTSGLANGIATAAHAGALELGAGTLAVMGGGLAVSCPARRRSLYERVRRTGCAVSELPCDCRGRHWGTVASERILAELAAVTVVVEAEQTPGDLAPARMAWALGRGVAAIPGRVTSPLSRGTHALLLEGASLVRGAQDVLELLYSLGAGRPQAQIEDERHAGLEPRLSTMLERVGAGSDTPDKLTSGAGEAAAVLLALTELELMGLLTRGDGGRYVPRQPLPPTGKIGLPKPLRSQGSPV